MSPSWTRKLSIAWNSGDAGREAGEADARVGQQQLRCWPPRPKITIAASSGMSVLAEPEAKMGNLMIDSADQQRAWTIGERQ